MTSETMTPDSALGRTLNGVLHSHPEHAGLIRAFTPLLLTHCRLVGQAGPGCAGPDCVGPDCAGPDTGAGGDENAAVAGSRVDLAFAWHTALALLDAMAEGFPNQAEACTAIRGRLAREELGRWCALWCGVGHSGHGRSGHERSGSSLAFSQEGADKAVEEARAWAEQQGLVAESVVFMLGRLCRILVARAVAGLPEAGGDGLSRACPFCGGKPELSVIHGSDGRRSLICGTCGRAWRFRRLMCPACGHEAAENLNSLFVDGRPEERGVACSACGRYVLEVDIRAMDVTPEQCQPLMLGLGHLDFLLQEEGHVPLACDSGEYSCE